MTRREWTLILALTTLLVLVLWSNVQTQQALDGLAQQLDAKERARIDLLEARVIALEKTQARLRARLEEGGQ